MGRWLHWTEELGEGPVSPPTPKKWLPHQEPFQQPPKEKETEPEAVQARPSVPQPSVPQPSMPQASALGVSQWLKGLDFEPSKVEVQRVDTSPVKLSSLKTKPSEIVPFVLDVAAELLGEDLRDDVARFMLTTAKLGAKVANIVSRPLIEHLPSYKERGTAYWISRWLSGKLANIDVPRWQEAAWWSYGESGVALIMPPMPAGAVFAAGDVSVFSENPQTREDWAKVEDWVWGNLSNPEEMDTIWREGHIGYTLMLRTLTDPSEVEVIRKDIRENNLSVEELTKKYGEFWPELVGRIVFDIPSKLLGGGGYHIFNPPSMATDYVIEKVKEGVVSFVKKMKIGDYLLRQARASMVVQTQQRVKDATTEAVIRTPSQRNPVETIDTILKGQVDRGVSTSQPAVTSGEVQVVLPDDFIMYWNSLDDNTKSTLLQLSDILTSEGIDGLDDVVKRYYPDLMPIWKMSEFQEELAKNPGWLSYMLGDVARRRAAQMLGIDGNPSTVGKIFAWFVGVWKEWLLGANPAYLAGNAIDNFVKGTLSGYEMMLYDGGAIQRAAQLCGELGIGVPSNVVDAFVGMTLGIPEREPFLGQVPIPLIGRPTEVLKKYAELFYREGSGKTPLERFIEAHPRIGSYIRSDVPPLYAAVLGWSKKSGVELPSTFKKKYFDRPPISGFARVLDSINVATISKIGLDLSSAIEESARLQIFTRALESRYMELHPEFTEWVRVSGAPSHWANYTNPRQLLDEYNREMELFKAGRPRPSWSFGSTMPQNISNFPVAVEIAKDLDNLTKDLFMNHPPEQWPDGMKDIVAVFDRAILDMRALVEEAGEAAHHEAIIALMKGDMVRYSSTNVLVRGRELRDRLLKQALASLRDVPDNDYSRRIAGVIWSRYFRASEEIATASWKEAVRMLSEQDPFMSSRLLDVIGKYRLAESDIVPPDLSGGEWGVFGETLLARRLEVDNAQAKAWDVFIRSGANKEVIPIITEAMEEASVLAEKAAAAAATLRNGYIKSISEGDPMLTPEEYREAIDAIWLEKWFRPSVRLWERTANRMADKAGIPRAGEVSGEDFLRVLSERGGLSQEEVDRLLEEYKLLAGEVISGLGGDSITIWENALLEWQREVSSKMLESMEAWTTTGAPNKQLYEEGIKRLGDVATRAKIYGVQEVNKLLFDYSDFSNIDQGMTYLVPFWKWQTRNPQVWGRLFATNPHVALFLYQFDQLDEEQRRRLNLTNRFKWTMPVPGYEVLQKMFPNAFPPGSYLAFDPSAGFSILGQPFTEELFGGGSGQYMSPEEENMFGIMYVLNRIVRAPEWLGSSPYPWIRIPLEMLGVYGNRPRQGLSGPLGRLIPIISQFEEEQSRRRNPDTAYMYRYMVMRRIASDTMEGIIDPEDAFKAFIDNESPVWKEAERRVNTERNILTLWRALFPFSLKYASPGEMAIRAQRAEFKDMPEERAAYYRTQEPAQTLYSRAIAWVNNPEWALWASKRDLIFERFSKIKQNIKPWDSAYVEVERLMWKKIDELGDPPPRAMETGYPTADTFVGILYNLEANRPRATQFVKNGVVDWDAYNRATQEYATKVESFGVSPLEWFRFRTRFLSPEELAWELRQKEFERGWEEYERLSNLPMPDILELLPEAMQKGELPSISLISEHPEVVAWLEKEAARRGWTPDDFIFWASTQFGLPYNEIVNILEREYGPRMLREYLPRVLEVRPWLAEVPETSKEWGRFPELSEEMMPGMFKKDPWIDWYYSLSPAQQRDVRARLGVTGKFHDFVRTSDVTRWLTATGQRPAMIIAEPPTEEERLEAERAMVQFQLGKRKWDDVLESYFGNPNSFRSKFWRLYYDGVWTRDLWDDPVLSAILNAEVRSGLKLSEEQYKAAAEYLERNRPKYEDTEAMALRTEHPDWYERALKEKEKVSNVTIPESFSRYLENLTPEERSIWQKENPEEWARIRQALDTRTDLLVQSPYYLYFFERDRYKKWFGDTNPSQLDISKEYDSFRQAQADMERYRDVGSRWTPAMSRWFGNVDSASNKFWEYYYNNKYFLRDDYRDDGLIMAVMSSDVRSYIPTESMERLYEKALEKLKQYFDPSEASRFNQYRNLLPQAERERREFFNTFQYDNRPTERAAERRWWNERTAWMKRHPVMVWFFYYDRYLQWWGDTPPNEATPISGGTAPKTSPSTPPGGGGGGGGGGTPSPPSDVPPPPPPPPPLFP